MKKVAIVGKPNVGKSSLFNRLTRSHNAIVSSISGVTRDRNYGVVSWINRFFTIIDTGGILKNCNLPFQDIINKQVNYAINEADIILFVVSQKEGIDNQDKYIAKLLKMNAKNKKILLVVNKCENFNHESENIYLNLKFGNFYPISCTHGIGVGDLLDQIILLLKNCPETNNEADAFKFCVIGKPNVGKSSLINAICHQDRVIVSQLANTTRDAIDCNFKYHNKKYVIIDTAGIRRKGKLNCEIDKYAYLRVQQAILRSNLIIMMLDGSKEFDEQDEIIAGLAYKANIPTIFVVNKWDLVKKTNTTNVKYIKLIRSKFNFLLWAPIIFISAKENKKINDIFNTIDKIVINLNKKINTNELNRLISKLQIINQPPKFKGNRLSINYATQVISSIPMFVLFVNNPKYLHFSYARYIENKIRETFDLNNVPITVYYKDKNSRIRQ